MSATAARLVADLKPQEGEDASDIGVEAFECLPVLSNNAIEIVVFRACDV
jgi:hypothetical protein